MTKEEFLTTHIIKKEDNIDDIIAFYKHLGIFCSYPHDLRLGEYIGVNDVKQLVSYYDPRFFNFAYTIRVTLEQAKALFPKNKHVVTEKDLIGDIKDFPIEIVQKMIERQVEQGFPEDVTVFQEQMYAGDKDKGFVWEHSIEGHIFWQQILWYNNFDLFFEKYPKQQLNFVKSNIISKEENNNKLHKTFKYKRR